MLTLRSPLNRAKIRIRLSTTVNRGSELSSMGRGPNSDIALLTKLTNVKHMRGLLNRHSPCDEILRFAA